MFYVFTFVPHIISFIIRRVIFPDCSCFIDYTVETRIITVLVPYIIVLLLCLYACARVHTHSTISVTDSILCLCFYHITAHYFNCFLPWIFSFCTIMLYSFSVRLLFALHQCRDLSSFSLKTFSAPSLL